MKKRFAGVIKKIWDYPDIFALGLSSSMGFAMAILGASFLVNLFIPVRQYLFFLFGLPLYYLLTLVFYIHSVKFFGILFKSGYLFGMAVVASAAIYRIISLLY